jgi:predicted peptidase
MQQQSADLQLHTSGALPYLLARPRGPAGAAGYPVLCFLHGLDEGAPLQIREALTRHGPLSPGARRGVASEFLVVAPQMPARGDLWHRHADEVRALVETVAVDHGCDRSHMFLTGFSFGANGVFDVALDHRGFWTALWAVDPTRVPSDDPRIPVWLSAGEITRRFEGNFIQQLRLEPLKEQPPGDRVYLDEGMDHVRTATSAYADERAYRWLLSRSGAKPEQGSASRRRTAPGESAIENRAEIDDRA